MIKLPKSLHAYFTDQAVKAAIDMLINRRRSPIPEDLNWEELQDYYRAMQAARQTQFDYAGFLYDLWDVTWSKRPSSWKEKALPTKDLDPVKMWDNYFIFRSFLIGSDTCHLRVWLGKDEGVQIGVDLSRAGRSLWRKKDLTALTTPGWDLGELGIWSPEEAIPISRIDPAKLQEFAREAIALCGRRVKE